MNRVLRRHFSQSIAFRPRLSNEELVELLKQRVEAKRMRDFATSDSIRTTLEGRGIHITDAKGQTQLGRWVALDGREGNTQGPDFFQKAPPACGQCGLGRATARLPGRWLG